MKSKKVKVLGTTYTITYKHIDDDPKLEELDGYCDDTTKDIVICLLDNDKMGVANKEAHYHHVLKHELVHAFLSESGLKTSSGWADNETIVDWIANQHDKLEKAIESVEK